MEARKTIPHYTVSDWEQWEGDWELIDGTAFSMAPSPTAMHQHISYEITNLLNNQMKNCEKCLILQDYNWKISEDTIVRPDVLAACGDKAHLLKQKRLDQTPLLIVEILSPSTDKNDRGYKHYLYEKAGVKYYCLADTEDKLLEFYELKNNQYELIYKGEGTILPLELESCVFTSDWSEIWK